EDQSPLEHASSLLMRRLAIARDGVARLVDRLFDLVLHGAGGVLHLAYGLVELAFVAQLVVVGQGAGRLLETALRLVDGSVAHDVAPFLVLLRVPPARRPRCS